MEKLGIDSIQLLTQIFNFSVMVLLLTKLLYKPILKNLDARRKKIEEGLKYSEQMKHELEISEQKKAEILAKARDEARKIIEEGKKSGKRLEEDIIAKAQVEAMAIVEKSKKDLAVQKVYLEKQLKQQTIEIASSMAAKVIEQALNSSGQQSIIDREIKKIARLVK